MSCTTYYDFSDITINQGITWSVRAKELNLNILLPSIIDVGDTQVQRKCISMLVANLSSCLVTSSPLDLYLDTSRKSVSGRYNKYKISQRMIVDCVKILEREGYVNVLLGHNHGRKDQHRLSRIVSTNKLMVLLSDEVINKSKVNDVSTSATLHLRDKDKNDVVFSSTSLIKSMEEQVRAFNICNLKFDWKHYDGSTLDLSTHKRVFNQSFSKGGRWYNELQQVKQKEDGVKNPIDKTRLGVTVDGYNVVEVDFVTLHPTMLMYLNGEEARIFHDNDVYELLASKLPCRAEDDRQLMKLSLNMMINATTGASAMKAIQLAINTSSLKFSAKSGHDVWKHIYNTLPYFKKQFDEEESAGLVLQFLDSKIASIVATTFSELGKPCGIVHDSFVVKEEDEELLLNVMSSAFRVVMGRDDVLVFLEVKRKDGTKFKTTR